MRVLELFSGIGGWRAALERLHAEEGARQEAGRGERKEENEDEEEDEEGCGGGGGGGVTGSAEGREEVRFAAYDISQVCNDVYEENFGGERPSGKSLERLAPSVLDEWGADLWLMSPPCQPFTRSNVTEKRDLADPRAAPLLHMVHCLATMEHLPRFLALENVVGFEESECCQRLKAALHERGYGYKQFILSPTYLGVPNDRPRYFLTATLHAQRPVRGGCDGEAILDQLPHRGPTDSADARPLSAFLGGQAPDEYIVPPESLAQRSAWCMDLVFPHSTRSACFTKSYTRFFRGSGSVLLVRSPNSHAADPSKEEEEEEQPAEGEGGGKEREEGKQEEELPHDLLQLPCDRSFDPAWVNAYADYTFRYFTPQELLRLFGFPETFRFPDTISRRKRYEMIGNSVNVTLLVEILRQLLS